MSAPSKARGDPALAHAAWRLQPTSLGRLSVVNPEADHSASLRSWASYWPYREGIPTVKWGGGS